MTDFECSAHQIYLRAVQLGVLFQPQGTWYEESVAAVQKYRDDLWAAEQKEWTAKRKAILDKLKPDLDRLEEKLKDKTSDWEFAECVWKEWPPKTDGEFGTSYSCGAPSFIPNIPGPMELPGLETTEKKRFLKVIQVGPISRCCLDAHDFNHISSVITLTRTWHPYMAMNGR